MPDLTAFTHRLLEPSGDFGWLDDAACVDLVHQDFFVEAGHVIDDEVLEVCRSCPVRRQCVTHAYQRKIIGGYFGGFSPGQRREMTLAEALAAIRRDPPTRPNTAASRRSPVADAVV